MVGKQSLDNVVQDENSGARWTASDHHLPEPLRSILTRAVIEGATDIHLDTWGDEAILRHRVDGALQTKDVASAGQARTIVNQIRVAAGMDVDAPRSPLEGRFSTTIDDVRRGFRATVVPTAPRCLSAHLRLLVGSEDWRDIARLGFGDEQRRRVEELVGARQGLLIVTGPTGSGKTTTLYALASLLDPKEHAVASIEDPVEYDMPHVRQLEVDEAHGLTMSEGLRALLRMDPDALIIGEVSDRDSAMTAAQAALAGRLVITTVHGRSAAAAVETMHHLAVPYYVLGGPLRLLIAQNLVRRLCSNCAERASIAAHERDLFQSAGVTPPESVLHPRGCERCNGFGFSGRVGVFELVVVDEELGSWLAAGQERHAIRERFAVHSVATLAEDALGKVVAGATAISEVLPLLVHAPRNHGKEQL